ncbi:MAG: PKD domain-containing protein [Acidobacteriota bacterium]
MTARWGSCAIPARLAVAVIAAVFLACAGCGNTPPSATNDQAIIVLQASPSKVTPRGRSTIIATGIKKTGTPIWPGTIITFTADRGRIDPAEGAFDGNGRAEVTYFAPDTICTANIDASSGSVDIAAITIEVGSAASSVVLTASRTSLPETGGTVTLRAMAYDESSNPVARTPIVFTATSGVLSSGGRPVLTNASGVAKDRLTTSADATAVAYSGSVASGEVQITVEEPLPNEPPTADFVYSPQSPVTGQKVYFNGDVSSDPDGRIVTWQWDLGDGTTAYGRRTSHSYITAATYAVVLCVTDEDGARDCQSYDVVVAEPAAAAAR